MDTLQFNHSPVDGHLGGFQFAAIKFFMNIQVQVFKLSVLLGTYLGVEFLGHMLSE